MNSHVIIRLFDRTAAIFLIALAALAIAVPVLNLAVPQSAALHIPTYLVALFGKYLCYALLALSIDLIWGYCGILSLGQGYIIDSFMVVVFGGVGNLWGTFVGSFVLGIANKFLEPFAGAVLGKIAILVLIILFIQKRPRGLFALKGRAVEA